MFRIMGRRRRQPASEWVPAANSDAQWGFMEKSIKERLAMEGGGRGVRPLRGVTRTLQLEGWQGGPVTPGLKGDGRGRAGAHRGAEMRWDSE